MYRKQTINIPYLIHIWHLPDKAPGGGGSIPGGAGGRPGTPGTNTIKLASKKKKDPKYGHLQPWEDRSYHLASSFSF
jgi:hypothetical protein